MTNCFQSAQSPSALGLSNLEKHLSCMYTKGRKLIWEFLSITGESSPTWSLLFKTIRSHNQGMALLYPGSGSHLWFAKGSWKVYTWTACMYYNQVLTLLDQKGGYWLSKGRVGKYQAIQLDGLNVTLQTISALNLAIPCCLSFQELYIQPCQPELLTEEVIAQFHWHWMGTYWGIEGGLNHQPTWHNFVSLTCLLWSYSFPQFALNFRIISLINKHPGKQMKCAPSKIIGLRYKYPVKQMEITSWVAETPTHGMNTPPTIRFCVLCKFPTYAFVLSLYL